MKNSRYLFLTFIIFGIVSCSGGDDNPSIETSNLVEEWKLEDLNYTGTSTINYEGTSMATSFSGELLESNAMVLLKDDNTWTSGGSYTIRLTSITEEMTNVQDAPVTNLSGSGTYSISGNILTTSQQDYDFEESYSMSPMGISEATISELTSERLVLTFDNTQVVTMNGMELEIKIEGFQTLTK